MQRGAGKTRTRSGQQGTIPPDVPRLSAFISLLSLLQFRAGLGSDAHSPRPVHPWVALLDYIFLRAIAARPASALPIMMSASGSGMVVNSNAMSSDSYSHSSGYHWV